MSNLLLGGYWRRREAFIAELDNPHLLGLQIRDLPTTDGYQPCIYSMIDLPVESRQWLIAARVETDGEATETSMYLSFAVPILIGSRKNFEDFVEHIRQRLNDKGFKLLYLINLRAL